MKVKRHKIRRDERGNLLCNRCNLPITDENFHIVMYHPDHPEIQIGPLHEDCIPFTKLCTKCFKPCFLYIEGSDQVDEITYLGSGNWLCLDCIDSMEKCDICNTPISSQTHIVDGKRICSACKRNHVFMCNCCNKEHIRNGEHPNVYEKLNDVESVSYDRVISHYQGKLCYTCFLKERDKFPISTVAKCKRCYEIFPFEKKDGVKDPAYCNSCIQRGAVRKCNFCNNLHHKFQTTRRKEGGDPIAVCGDCGKHIGCCRSCYKILDKSDLVDGSVIVKRRGNSSGVVISSSEGPSRSNTQDIVNDAVCKSCAASLVRCPVCLSLTEKLISRFGFKYCNKCKDTLRLCNTCKKPHMGEESCRPNTNILGYSYRPAPCVIYGNGEVVKNDTLLIGIENEVTFYAYENSLSANKLITERFNATELYIKVDSSIRGERGFEIVTHPMTFLGFKEFHWDDLFNDIHYLKHTSCGMHVHINRSSFASKLHMFKFTKFMNTWDDLRDSIAGRKEVSYSRKIEENIASVCLEKVRIERYSIVNFQPSNTIEVRIFAGATTKKELMDRVQFVCALHSFAKKAHINAKPSDFVAWVDERKKIYNFLK